MSRTNWIAEALCWCATALEADCIIARTHRQAILCEGRPVAAMRTTHLRPTSLLAAREWPRACGPIHDASMTIDVWLNQRRTWLDEWWDWEQIPGEPARVDECLRAVRSAGITVILVDDGWR